MHRQWNQGQVSVKSIGTLPGYVDGVRKAKAQMELNLARDTQNNNKVLQVCQLRRPTLSWAVTKAL